mmetsp:Transcript_114178/g.254811  ORF Transcript_114178/g.254811 Transcript_114178/m.254811 type:complete len:1201 (-) Transcript_114178:167-3769(-)
MAASSDFDFALVEFEGGASAGLSTPGQTVAWLPEEETYLVATFDGDLVSVAAEKLSAYKPPLPEKGGFDVAFPKSEERRAVFTEELLDVLQRKHHCVVQMSSTPTERRAAVNAAEDASDWMRLNPDFEMDFIGRLTKNKKLQWASDEHPGEGADTGVFLGVNVMNDMGSACMACSLGLGFSGTEQSNILMTMKCSDEEEAPLLKALEDDLIKVVDGREIRDLLAFSARRRVCMMYFLCGSGGTMTLHALDPASDDMSVACNENQLLVFETNIFDYTFEPGPSQLSMQAWILRQQFGGEEGGLEESFPETVLEIIDKIPEGHSYGDTGETVDIMGLAPKIPGQVWCPEHYWAMLCCANDAIIPVPHQRWDHDLYWSETGEPGKGYVRHYGMMDQEQLAHFDCNFFGMTENEAFKTCPTARNMLECGYEALYRGGWTKETLKNQEFGHCMGYAETEYCQLLMRGAFGVESDTRSHTMAANVAARMHYCMGTNGPCATIETACSSSLTATALMHTWLRPVSSDAMVASTRKQVMYGMAWGANAHFDPFYTISLCGASMLTHNGRCFTFDQSADGFVRGEGQACMYYKVSSKEDFSRLNMLCGSCMNQDGRSASLTAPHGPSQQECIRHSLREAGIDPLAIQIQELHGTGTALGDPIEVGALRATMMTYQGVTRDHALVKTSSKSNLGHTELCAGILGIMKCVLLGMNAVAAPNIHLRLLNPHIDSNGYPVYFSSEFVDQGKAVGFNGVSSFGFGGSNARGDVWGRCVNGPRNTNPSLPDWTFDLTSNRIKNFATVFGTKDSLKAKDSILEESLMDYDGDFLSGDPRNPDNDFFCEGSFNGWTKGEKMVYFEDKDAYCFALSLGESRVEQFHFSVNEFLDAKIFPTNQAASMDERVLGPGPAPPGHYWVIDGRADKVAQGTVYLIMFNWDATTRTKKVTWEPSVDERALQFAANNSWKHGYAVVASWNRFKPMLMQPVIGTEPGLFETQVKLGLHGHEEFHFFRDDKADQMIYPALQHKTMSGDVPVRGPDGRGKEKYFRITGETGDVVTLQLQVWDGEITVSTVSSAAGMTTCRSIRGSEGKRYFVVGDLLKYPMYFSAQEVWETTIKVPECLLSTKTGTSNGVHFHIVEDEDEHQAIHPEMPGAGLGLSCAVGPDHNGAGLDWAIMAKSETSVVITLDMSQTDKRLAVHWAEISGATATPVD